MEIRKFEINGKQVEFVNQSRGTRSGFAHDTTVFINGCQRREATCHYINRTWERYTYQSVMMQAVWLLEEAEENYLREKFKREKGYNKLTAKRKLEFTEILDNNEDIKFYRALREALR